MKKRLKALPWSIITILGLIALVRPVIKIIGSFSGFDITPVVTVVITAVIAFVWIGVAVAKKLRDPILTLAAAGAIYALSSIILAVIIQTIALGSGSEEAVSIPLLLTMGLVATTIYNILWGGLLGVVAKLLIKLRRK